MCIQPREVVAPPRPQGRGNWGMVQMCGAVLEAHKNQLEHRTIFVVKYEQYASTAAKRTDTTESSRDVRSLYQHLVRFPSSGALSRQIQQIAAYLLKSAVVEFSRSFRGTGNVGTGDVGPAQDGKNWLTGDTSKMYCKKLWSLETRKQ